jgi:tRNA (guanine-N7-)-methyltransferase
MPRTTYAAWWQRDHDHLGIDVLPVVIRYATRRGNQRELTNLVHALDPAVPDVNLRHS